MKKCYALQDFLVFVTGTDIDYGTVLTTRPRDSISR